MPLRPGGTFGPHPLTAMEQSAIPYRTYPYYAKYRKWYRWHDTGRERPLYSDRGREAVRDLWCPSDLLADRTRALIAWEGA